MWNADQLSRLARLTDELLDTPEDARREWQAAAKAKHPDLASAIDSMSQSTSTAGQVAPPALTLPLAPEEQLPTAGADVGPYRLISPLGHGGMSMVWLAAQTDGRVHRHVALKLIARPLVDAGWQLRFERERNILANLRHPGIARLIDAGLSDRGQAYLVMDLIDGYNIVDYANGRALSLRGRIELVVSLLDAVAYAHEMSVVHRDIKPSNVMVDRRGHVMLLDFGIAKLLEPQAMPFVPEVQQLTALYGQAMTLDYASPEQVEGLPVACTSDVYSIGVLLFELLTGQRPYTLRRNSRAAMEEAILEQVLPAPSQRVDPSWASKLGTSADELSQQLMGPLDAILFRALQRESARRYPDAKAFGQELQVWLEGRSVQAPDTEPRGVDVPVLASSEVAPVITAERIRNQIKEHLAPSNAVLGLGIGLVTITDLLIPSLTPVAVALRNIAALVAVALLIAAVWPSQVDRALAKITATSPEAREGRPRWRLLLNRRWLLPAAFVTVGLTASLSHARAGGVIASQFPSLRTLQQQLLGIQTSVAEVSSKVSEVKQTVGALAAREHAIQRQAATSPLSVGLLDLQPTGPAVQADGSAPARLAVYLNESGYGFPQAKLAVVTLNSKSQRHVMNLSSHLGTSAAPGAVQVPINVPVGTREMVACLSVPPSAGRPARTIVQRWGVSAQEGGVLFESAEAPELRVSDPSPCAS